MFCTRLVWPVDGCSKPNLNKSMVPRLSAFIPSVRDTKSKFYDFFLMHEKTMYMDS